MKYSVFTLSRVGLALCSAVVFHAFTSTAADPNNVEAASQSSASVKLPYGVEDVLKLTRAKVADDTIVSYVQNSGTVYNLEAKDILYLRNEGVSDQVISAMLEQRKKLTDSLTQTAPNPASSSVAPAPQGAPAPTVEQQPAQSQPAPVYVQPPATPPSTVYVVPQPTYAPYYGYPYYPYYYGGPRISLGFVFGGGHYHGGWGHHHH